MKPYLYLLLLFVSLFGFARLIPATSGCITLPSANWSVSTGACGIFPAPFLCSASTIPAVSCDNPVYPTEIIGKGSNPMSIQEGGYDSCAHLKAWRYKSDQPHVQYDSLRYYIEKCAANDDQSYLAFNNLDADVQLMSNDSNRYDEYRVWLISVLYLNKTNPAYFCSCISSIGNTYPTFGMYRSVQNVVNASLAVRNWLRINHPDCIAGDSVWYFQDTSYLRAHGIDPTQLPSLDSIGLGFLLNQNGVTPTTSGIGISYLASFTSSPNPFQKETTFQFTLNRMTYTTVSIYDELGRLVWGDGRGTSLEAGEHSIHIDASSFPSGTLYARISTGFGEVKTVKLVKQ